MTKQRLGWGWNARSVIAAAAAVLLAVFGIVGCITILLTLEALANHIVNVVYPVPTRDFAMDTTPLPSATIIDICRRLSLSANDRKCRPDAEVYAPEFFEPIRQSLRLNQSSYEEVEALLGDYRVSCSNKVHPKSGADFFCNYDLRGDHMYVLTLYYRGSGPADAILTEILDNAQYVLP